MATAEKPVESQITPDGQRVVETFERTDEDDNKFMESVAREATMAEQVEHYANDVMRWAVGTVTMAKSGTVEVGGSDEDASLIITLSGSDPDAPVEEPAPAPTATKAKASSSS